jgi:septal ring factor EnvC (AmiA/AmiB activator)
MNETSIFGAVLTAAAAIAAFTKFLVVDRINDLKTDVKELKSSVATVVGKLEECQEEHAQAREKVARLEATTEVLAKHQPPKVQTEAREAADNSRHLKLMDGEWEPR